MSAAGGWTVTGHGVAASPPLPTRARHRLLDSGLLPGGTAFTSRPPWLQDTTRQHTSSLLPFALPTLKKCDRRHLSASPPHQDGWEKVTAMVVHLNRPGHRAAARGGGSCPALRDRPELGGSELRVERSAGGAAPGAGRGWGGRGGGQRLAAHTSPVIKHYVQKASGDFPEPRSPCRATERRTEPMDLNACRPRDGLEAAPSGGGRTSLEPRGRRRPADPLPAPGPSAHQTAAGTARWCSTIDDVALPEPGWEGSGHRSLGAPPRGLHHRLHRPSASRNFSSWWLWDHQEQPRNKESSPWI
ncbi:uncharacterized protein LOC118571508 [Onychomys torridus]|uniref:uncharacterized protein LOC118571508 n=1 Tax=Onychomys torridus TaxID=38674 RepID=UPI00167FABF1|nr:uncharacterized protein LOC118571508 [Onychomys torridus]